MKTYRFLISGQVQGVWFRKYTKDRADKMGISGYVKNLSDGRVEAAATLKEEQFAKFLDAIKQGPPFANVEDIKIEEINEVYQDGFEIRR